MASFVRHEPKERADSRQSPQFAMSHFNPGGGTVKNILCASWHRSSHGIKPPRPTSKGAANAARPAASGAVGTSSGRKPGSTKVNAGKNGETQGKMI